MSKKSDSREELRKELRKAIDVMRNDIRKVRNDLSTATKAWMKTTEKVMQDVTPKVSATVDQTMQHTSDAFRKTMVSLGKETKQFQLGFLKSYKTVLDKQMALVEKRLRELKK